MAKSVKDSAYRKYKKNKKREEIENIKKARKKAMTKLSHNPLKGGPLSNNPLEED